VEIETCLKDGSLVISPFEGSCLNGAGYDLRLGGDLAMRPGEHKLVATLERVEIGESLVGTLHIRSTLARSGIIASLALVDPGFRGQLTVSLFNAGSESFSMAKEDRFLQMVLHHLGTKTHRPYAGKYQDSQGIVDTRQSSPYSLCKFVSKVLLPLSMGMCIS
jgi:dCTP deaminase